MKRTRALLIAVLVLAPAAAAPPAAAAACGYDRRDLPAPAGADHHRATGSSTNNSRIVGWYSPSGGYARGVLWVNSTLREMAPLHFNVRPTAVNNTSVVAGYEEVHRGELGSLYRAFRYENGAYEYLGTEPGEHSRATGVNDAGDVVGTVWREESPLVRTVVLWPRNGTRKSFGQGVAIGVTGQKIVMTTDWSGWVVDTGTGVRTELPGAGLPMVLDNDRVLNTEYLGGGRVQLTEWDLNGVRVGAYDGGFKPLGKNGSGTVFGAHGDSTPALWRKTGRTDVVADRLPDVHEYADVTDAATLIGTYEGADGKPRAARWLWICS
ncbi:hypothetical protein [Lentzea aerocolonigenes]|uniref:hypothetical protein n=1 Tax=Lentzea aerocolonigenes TaxID=68170 RepID=UPI0004C46E04|nr:hypothetical protein [Lentzea aerocolonigenes]